MAAHDLNRALRQAATASVDRIPAVATYRLPHEYDVNTSYV